MYTLETLGRTGLSDADGVELDRLLRQPKRLALLAYLAAPAPGTWHRRDILLGIFWPELDSVRGRTALRNALHVIRQTAGHALMRTRGDEEVSVDPELLVSDARLMEEEAARGDHQSAFRRYRGLYLNGLYVKDAGEFERWLDGERQRLAAIARKSGLSLAVMLEQQGDYESAAEALDKVAVMDPADESVARQLMGVLERSGDRSRALAVYERLRSRMDVEYGVEPSRETVDQAEAIRSSRVATPVRAMAANVTEREALAGVGDAAVPAAADTGEGAASPSSPAIGDAARLVSRVPHEAGDSPVANREMRGGWWRAGRWWFTGLATVAVLAMLLIWQGNASPALRGPRAILVMPMSNETGDTSLAYLASGIADEIARQIRGIGGLQIVHSAARAEWPAAAARDPREVGRRYGARVSLRTALRREGDSLVIGGSLTDVERGSERKLPETRFTIGDVTVAAGRVAAGIAGMLFRGDGRHLPLPQRDLNPESARLAMAGWYSVFYGDDISDAQRLFLAALESDASNERAWAGLSSVWSALAVQSREQFDVAAERSEEAGRRALALDSTDGTPWANLGVLEAIRSRRLADGVRLIDRGIALDPSNPELYLIKSALYRHAWDWDAAMQASRLAAEMDPLSPKLQERLANVSLCRDDPAEALRLVGQALVLDSSYAPARRLASRALARLGRFSDANAMLGLPTSAGGSAEDTYWKAMESRWGAALGRLQQKKKEGGWVSATALAAATIAAGQLDGGMELLEAAASTGDLDFYRLPCKEEVDRVRTWPRYRAVMNRLPRWSN